MSKLTVVAHITAKAAHTDEVKEALLSLVPPTLRENGCLNYDLHQDLDEPSLFVFHENWESEAHLEEHLQSSHIAAFKESAEGLIENLVIHKLRRIS